MFMEQVLSHVTIFRIIKHSTVINLGTSENGLCKKYYKKQIMSARHVY